MNGDASQMPLSKTCNNCAHAKIKCIRSADASICDRCHRLNKECIFRPAKRRVYGSRKDPRIEALEAKVNELLTAQNPSSSGNSASPDSSINNLALSEQQPSAPTIVVPTTAYPERIVTPSHLPLSVQDGLDVVDAGILPIETADELLNQFRTFMTPHFPFVVIPAHATAGVLKRERPFLFLTVMAAAAFDNLHLQRFLGDEVKKTVANRLIIGGEVSFELLQGLLVHLAWGQYHARPRRFTQFLGLAISIIADLRLDSPPCMKSWKVGPGVTEENTSSSPERGSWGRDVQRAVAGCYYLSSSVCGLLEKTSMFSFNTYIEECCENLRRVGEYASDQYLLSVVQLQHLLERIGHHNFQHSPALLNPDSAIHLFSTSFKSELELFRQRLPFSMHESHLVGMLFYTVELYLYQISLWEGSLRSRPDQETAWPPWRLDMVRAGLISSKSLLEFYLSMPLGSEKAWNNTEIIQIGFALTVSAKFFIATQDKKVAQPTEALREAFDPSSLYQRTVTRLEALCTDQRDSNGDRDIFHRHVQRVKLVQKCYENQLAKERNGPGTRDVASNYDPQPQAQHTHAPFEGIDSGFDPMLDINDMSTQGGFSDLPFTNFFASEATYDAVMGGWMPDPIGPGSAGGFW